MKKEVFLIILLTVCSFNLYSQDFDCSTYYKKYYEDLNNDALNPNKECINNLDAFCAGVKQGLESKELSIKQIGSPDHIGTCSYASYENYGVNLIMTGGIIDDAKVNDENAGFNFIMKQRIQDSLGLETYKGLGKKDSKWIELNSDLIKAFCNTLVIENATDSTIILIIDEIKIAKTDFKNLDGVIFTDALGNDKFSYNDLLNGIKINCTGDRNKRGFLLLDFKEYSNPRFCKCKLMPRWIVPIRTKI
ncbi:hypothetical protein [Aureibacter tunicatorum]|uniref:Uncharacterized protein n=1 Tax=Aureibacter tunicatorum TaxID=866807 RepID=A0AAE3XM83_9BACT|nr:hypothetical protein [Aureibacter tunicatorum]MDR6238529.1 hypothetical protein [Aureibacter tunicatorum]BDD05539.1 hypothetical protein AUTU_30220 [Aureibacter tunicatorum]